MNKDEIMDFAKIRARHYMVNPKLVFSIIAKESTWNTFAIKYEPDFKWRESPQLFARRNYEQVVIEYHLQGCSLGLMQVMGCVARELGHKDSLLKLTVPEIGIELGCKKLAQITKKYKTLQEIVASYNAGSPRYKNGKFINQDYVDSVISKMKDFSDD